MTQAADGRSTTARRSALQELAGGWKTLLGSMIGFSVGSGLYPVYLVPTVGVGLEVGFGWTRVDTSSLITAILIGSVTGLPIVGWLADKVSPRWLAVVSLSSTTLLLALAGVSTPSPTSWRIGAFLFGFLGAGSLAPTFTKAICLDFIGARGLAMGITLGAMGLSGAGLAPLAQASISRFGVPHTCLMLAGVYLCVFLPLVHLLLPARRMPRNEVEQASLGTDQAMPYATLLILGGATVLISAAANSGAAHLVPFMKDVHAASPASAATVMALTVMISRPIVGALMDRLPAGRVGAAAFAASAAGLALIAHAGPPWALVGAFLIGLAVGAEADVIAYLTSRYVPVERYGRTYTWLYVSLMLTTALGPLGVAMLRERLGDYSVAFTILSVCALGAAVLLLSLPRYPRISSRASAQGADAEHSPTVAPARPVL